MPHVSRTRTPPSLPYPPNLPCISLALSLSYAVNDNMPPEDDSGRARRMRRRRPLPGHMRRVLGSGSTGHHHQRHSTRQNSCQVKSPCLSGWFILMYFVRSPSFPPTSRLHSNTSCPMRVSSCFSVFMQRKLAWSAEWRNMTRE